MAGQELPDLRRGGGVERPVAAALQLGHLGLGEVGGGGVGRDTGLDQVGELVLRVGGSALRAWSRMVARRGVMGAKIVPGWCEVYAIRVIDLVVNPVPL